MGLFDKIFGKQLLKVIEWTDDSSDILVYKYPMDSRYAIMKGSQLVVRPSQRAVFVNEGKIADIFEEGRYVLDTSNLPILTALCNWKYAFENPFQGEIYFINTRQFTDLKWGTQNPVMMRDADFGMIRLRGYGAWSFRVNDDEKAIYELFGTKSMTRVSDVADYFKRVVVSGLSDAIAEAKIPALDLASRYVELGDETAVVLNKKFDDFGLKITSLVVENLSLPEEVEKVMDTRTSMGVLGDSMTTFTQYQAAQALRDAAQNTGSGTVGAGVGMGAGLGIGNMMAQTLGNVSSQPASQPVATPTTPKKICPSCNHEVGANVKFCPECGGKMPTSKFCPECGASVGANAKFCPDCGTKLN